MSFLPARGSVLAITLIVAAAPARAGFNDAATLALLEAGAEANGQRQSATVGAEVD